MKKSCLAFVTTLLATAMSWIALSVPAAPAHAATCFKTVTVSGQNAYGYAKAYSWQNYSAYTRTAATGTLCINYAAAYGGYYVASASCGHNSARLTGDNTAIVRAGSSGSFSRTSLYCSTSTTWKWTRSVANDQCAYLSAQTRWSLNQSNGSVTHQTSLPQGDYFVPRYC